MIVLSFITVFTQFPNYIGELLNYLHINLQWSIKTLKHMGVSRVEESCRLAPT